MLPQGKCQIPLLEDAPKNKIEVFKKTASFLVLGIGTIIYRKGVDLFIQMALELRQLESTASIQLLWVGDTHVAEQSFAANIFDQIARYHLEDCLQVMAAVDHIESLYQTADILFFLHG